MISLIRIYLITYLIYLFISQIPNTVLAQQKGAQPKIIARIQEKTSIRLFGYSSANAIIQVTGIRVFAQTSANRQGFFEINELPVSEEASELCIISIDSEQRIGFPVCVGLPDTPTTQDIGPVLLSPTLSLSTDNIWQNKNLYASGKTIPEKTVEISVFEAPSSSIAFNFKKNLNRLFASSVYAFELPNLITKSDSNGNFSFTLPTNKSLGYRIFVKGRFEDNPTSKSKTLSYKVGSSTNYFISFILPWLIFAAIIIIAIGSIIYFEWKTNKLKSFVTSFIERTLKPFAIKIDLQLRQLLYNFQKSRKSDQK